MMTYLVVGVVVLFLLAAFQRKALQRVGVALGAQFAKMARLGWQADPVAVYQNEVDHSAEQIREATNGLEQYRGFVASKERQVSSGTKEVARLTARVKAALTQGKENEAATFAVQLKKAQDDLAENTKQLEDYNVAYNNNLKKVKHARERIETARANARRLQADLHMSKAEAETARLAESFNVKANTLDGLGEVEDEIRRQIDVNRGKAQVARDLSADGIADIEAEEEVRKAEARELLEKMKAEMK